MLYLKKTTLLFLLALIMLGCEENTKEKSSSEKYLAPSSGNVGELLLVLDTNALGGSYLRLLEDIFLSPYDGLPQPETNFHLQKVHFSGFGGLLTKVRNIVFLVPFEDGKSTGFMQKILGDEAYQNILKNDSKVYYKKDVYAQNQTVIFVFAKTTKDLEKTLAEEHHKIIETLENAELGRLKRKLFSTQKKSEVESILKKDFGYNINIPQGYEIIKKSEEFTWIRMMTEQSDINIVISSKPYLNQTQFDSLYIANWRDSLNLNIDGGDISSAKVIQQYYPISTKIITTPDYTLENRGLWKLKNNTLGGPFVSQVKLSNDKRKIIYLEGFVFAPSRKKRDLIREVEAILSTFSM